MVVDGEVGRQLKDSPPLLKALKDKGELNDTILLSLETNGPFNLDDFAQIMNILGTSIKSLSSILMCRRVVGRMM